MKRWALLLVLLLAPRFVLAASCTDGTDCFNDCRTGSGCVAGSYRNAGCTALEIKCTTTANIIAIEDNEDSNYVNLNASGAFWRDGGTAGYRGGGSSWLTKWGAAAFNCDWHNGEGGGGAFGSACAFGECGVCEWTPGDALRGNSCSCLDIQAPGEYDDEVAGLSLSAFKYGQHVMAMRVGGNGTASGRGSGAAVGGKTFSSSTDAYFVGPVAYSTNMLTAAAGPGAGPCNYSGNNGDFPPAPWKHIEFRGTMPGGIGGLSFFNNVFFGGSVNADPDGGNMPARAMPMGVFLNMAIGANKTNCQNALNSALSVGEGHCGNGSYPSYVQLWAKSSFDRSDDWPLGTWALIRSRWTGLGTSNCSFTLSWWHESAGAEETLVSMSGFDCATYMGQQNINEMIVNNYYNGGQSSAESCVLEPFYIYYNWFEYGRNQALPTAAEVGWPKALGASPTPWTVDAYSLVSPSTCTQGSCTDPANISASGSNGSGNIAWLVDCDIADGSGSFTGVDPDTLGTGSTCVNSTTCARTDACSYSAKAPGTYTSRICATRGTDPQSCRDTTFQVQAVTRVPGIGSGGATVTEYLERLLFGPYGRPRASLQGER